MARFPFRSSPILVKHQYVVAESPIIQEMVNQKISALVSLAKMCPQMSAYGSDLPTDRPPCPHFISECLPIFGCSVRIRIEHGRFFDPKNVRTGIEPLTA